MEIAALSVLPIEELARYTRTRVPAKIYLPLALFLCTAALADGQPMEPINLTLAFALAVSLLFQFRLWDDLSDREFDRLDHPERVLVKTSAVIFFWALVFAAFLLNFTLIAALTGPRWRLEAFMFLNVASLLWYPWLRKLCRNEIAGSHVVLGKYPIFIYLLSGESAATSSVRLALAMLLVYLCFCVYELLHDAKLNRVPGALKLLAGEMTALCAVSGVMAITLTEHGGAPAVVQAAITVAGGLFLARLFLRSRAGLRTELENYAVFVVGFFQALTFSLGGRP
jgi:4-hydroxybenzoate polyprenyltransferase